MDKNSHFTEICPCPVLLCRIVVSAPGQTIPTASVNNTGAVYTCEVNRGVCSPSSFIKLYDTQGKYCLLLLLLVVVIVVGSSSSQNGVDLTTL